MTKLQPQFTLSRLRFALVACLSAFCVAATVKGVQATTGQAYWLCLLLAAVFYSTMVYALHFQPGAGRLAGALKRAVAYAICVGFCTATAAYGAYEFIAPKLTASREQAEMKVIWQQALTELAAYRRAMLERIAQQSSNVNRQLDEEKRRLRALPPDERDQTRQSELEAELQSLNEARAAFSPRELNAGKRQSQSRSGRFPSLDATPPDEIGAARGQLQQAFDLINEAHAAAPPSVRDGITPPAPRELPVTVAGSLDTFLNDTRRGEKNALRCWALPLLLEALILILVTHDKRRGRSLDRVILDARTYGKRLRHACRAPITLRATSIPYVTVSDDGAIPAQSGVVQLGGDEPMTSLDDFTAHKGEIEEALSHRLGQRISIAGVSRSDGRQLDEASPLDAQLDGSGLRLHVVPAAERTTEAVYE